MSFAANALIDDAPCMLANQLRRHRAIRRKPIDARKKKRRVIVNLTQAIRVHRGEKPRLVRAVRTQCFGARERSNRAHGVGEVRGDPLGKFDDFLCIAQLRIAHAARDRLRLGADRQRNRRNAKRAITLAFPRFIAARDDLHAIRRFAAIGKKSVRWKRHPMTGIEVVSDGVVQRLNQQRCAEESHARTTVVAALPLGDGVWRRDRMKVVARQQVAQRTKPRRNAAIDADRGRTVGGHASRLPACRPP